MRPLSIGLGALWLVAAAPLTAQQMPQVQTPSGSESGSQHPGPTAIPEKFGPSLDAKKPIPPEEQARQGNSGMQPPHNRGLDLQSPGPHPKSMSEPPARSPHTQ